MIKRWRDLSLSVRVFSILAAIILITVGGGIGSLWQLHRMNLLFERTIEGDLSSLSAAAELETALLSQKGFVTYYFLDGDPQWLEQLGRHRQSFQGRLSAARELERTAAGKDALAGVEAAYRDYLLVKDRVIELYRSGERDEGAALHWRARELYAQVYQRCESYQRLKRAQLETVKERNQREARLAGVSALVLLLMIVILGSLLVWVLVRQVLSPIHKLAREAGPALDETNPADETVLPRDDLLALKRRVHGLLEDMGQARTELEKSRELLASSEKLAVVGQLAAGVAHSIRNPMTSIKMRLFSLERSLALTPIQKEDFEVVAEEMRRLDNIVRNFLEFAKPHRLKMHEVQVSDAVDMALELLQHRLEHHNVVVQRVCRKPPPPVTADLELLKEVFVNLIVNACESMGDGGTLTVTEDEAVAEKLGRALLVRFTDTGPGVPEHLIAKVTEPFYTTKEEGTGLGLSIVARIIEEHGGRLEIGSEASGASFTVILPLKEEA